jgi:uncharacterized protein (TIGR02453 family)
MAGFEGFRPAAQHFFRDLAANNNRDWFLAHKAEYEAEVRAPLAALVQALSFAFATLDVPLTGDPKRSIFRINRDVRFSHDKSPYKTNAGAVLSRDGTKTGRGLLYLQPVSAEGAFVALGFYHSEPADLAALRQAMIAAPKGWAKLEASLAKAGLELSREEALQRLPKGYEAAAGSPVAEALKLRNLVVQRPLTPEQVQSAGLVEEVVAFAQAGLPLLRFGWQAFAEARA